MRVAWSRSKLLDLAAVAPVQVELYGGLYVMAIVACMHGHPVHLCIWSFALRRLAS